MVVTGLEYLHREPPASLRGASVGILANPTAVTREFVPIYDVLRNAGASVVALYGPEHGARGDVAEGVSISDSHDVHLGIPVYSLYGSRSTPTDNMLAGVEIMLIDLQDVGARFYTYAHTLADLMTTCGRAGVPVWVLDRPNPVTGVLCEGPVLEPGLESGVGKYPVPVRHALTLAELARLFVARFGIECELEVIPMRNWDRSIWFDQTSLPWIAPSPNMPTLDTATVYPGACLIEGTNVSEGRGTTRPFELIGAPWVNASELTRALEELRLPGVKFRQVSFVPSASKHNGANCRGVQIHVTDRMHFKPVLTGIAIISLLHRLHHNDFRFSEPSPDGRRFFDLLAGTEELRRGVENGVDPRDIAQSWEGRSDAFTKAATEIMLY